MSPTTWASSPRSRRSATATATCRGWCSRRRCGCRYWASCRRLARATWPSGSGKTTLLTLIGALRTSQEGTLEVMGHDLSRLGTKNLVRIRRNIGFIFQAHNLFESLTAYQNVRLALQLHKYEPKAAHE